MADSISTQQAGIHYYGLQLVQGLLHDFPEHDFEVICSADIPELDVSKTIVPLESSGQIGLRWRQWRIVPPMVNAMKPDLVIELAHFGPVGLDARVQRATVIHDLTPLMFPAWHTWYSVLAHRLFLSPIVRRSDFVIVNSDCTAADVQQRLGVPADKIHISYPNVQLPAPAEQNLPQMVHQPFFLSVGTIEPRKNYPCILRAFERYCQQGGSYQWVLAGGMGWKEGSFLRDLESSAWRHRVAHLGYVSRQQLTSLYHQASALIFASSYEGFGLPMAEAQSVGLPLVVAKNKSLPDYLLDCILLFENDDHESLSLHLLGLERNHELRTQLHEASKRAYRRFLELPRDLGPIING